MDGPSSSDLISRFADVQRSLQEANAEASRYKSLYEDAVSQSAALRRRVDELEGRLARLGGEASEGTGLSFGGPFATNVDGTGVTGSEGAADISLGLADPQRQAVHEQQQVQQMRAMLQAHREQEQRESAAELPEVKGLPTHIFSDEDRAALANHLAELEGHEGEEEQTRELDEPSSSAVAWIDAGMPAEDYAGLEQPDGTATYTNSGVPRSDDASLDFAEYADLSPPAS